MKLASGPSKSKNDQTLVDPRLRTVNHWLFNLLVVFLGLEYQHGVPHSFHRLIIIYIPSLPHGHDVPLISSFPNGGIPMFMVNHIPYIAQFLALYIPLISDIPKSYPNIPTIKTGYPLFRQIHIVAKSCICILMQIYGGFQ